jgi:hypothetical protein
MDSNVKLPGVSGVILDQKGEDVLKGIGTFDL